MEEQKRRSACSRCCHDYPVGGMTVQIGNGHNVHSCVSEHIIL